MKEPRQNFAHNIRAYQRAFKLSRSAFAEQVNEIIESLNIGCKFIGAKDVESYDSRESMPRDLRIMFAIIELFKKALPKDDSLVFLSTSFSVKDFKNEQDFNPDPCPCIQSFYAPSGWLSEAITENSKLKNVLNSLTKEEQNYVFKITSAMYDIKAPSHYPNGEEENYTYKAIDVNIAIKYIDGQKVEIAVVPYNDSDNQEPLQIYSFEWSDYAKEITSNYKDLDFFLFMLGNRIFPQFLKDFLDGGGISARNSAYYEYENDYDKFYTASADLEISYADHLTLLKFNLDNYCRRLEEAKNKLEQLDLEELNSLKIEQLDP